MSRILVVGGGVVGLCVAHACAAKGHEVVVVERGAPERDGCSFANAGMIVPSHFVPLASPGMVGVALRYMTDAESPFHLKARASLDLLRWGWHFVRACTPAHVARSAPLLRDLHLASRACYAEWAARWGNPFEFVESGMLVLCNSEHALAEESEVARLARELAVPAEVLTPADVAKLEPGVRLTIAGAIHFPRDARVAPARLMAALRRETQRLGVDLRHGVEVRGFRVHGPRIDAVETSDGVHAADAFVLCAGIWSSQLASTLGLSLPMQSGKGYSLTLEQPAVTMQRCAILSEARAAVTPMGGALRFGGTMEITGVDERVEPARIRGLVKSIGAYFPDVGATQLANAAVRTGLRPCSPDGLPYVGRFRRFANLAAATGHAMMGVSLAPITGRLVAQVLSGEAPDLDIAALSPDRYGGAARAGGGRETPLARATSE